VTHKMRHQHLVKQFQGDANVPFVVCDACGKNGYHTRRDARTVRNRTPGKLGIYICEGADPKAYHIGGAHGVPDRATARAIQTWKLRQDGEST